MNDENLTHVLTPEDRLRGARASTETRRKKKAIKSILNEMLDADVKSNPQFSKLAQKLGMSGKKSVKEVFVLVCLINSVKTGNLTDLGRLAVLLGEETGMETNNGILTELTEYLKNEHTEHTEQENKDAE